MKQLSSLEIKFCVDELQILLDGKVEKIYHHPPNEIRLRIYAKEKYELVIEAGRRIHLTQFPKESPKYPTPFAMLLRKHLEGARLKSLEQYDFDRVVILNFERGGETKKLVAELFSKGNIILIENSKVVMPLVHNVKIGEVYKFPEIKAVQEDREVVKVLANRIGGIYAEEVLKRLGIDKKRKYSEISEEEKQKIRSEIERLKNSEKEPQIVIRDGNYIDVTPIKLSIYEELEKKYFKTFNEALDEYYTKVFSEIVEKNTSVSKELERLKKRLEIQEETLKSYEREAERYMILANTMYANYQKISKILESLQEARKKMEWRKLEEKIKNDEKISKFLRLEGKKAVLIIEGQEIELDIEKNVHENAEIYYEAAKKAKEKANGVKEAIKKTLEEIKRVEKEEEVRFQRSFRVKRRREWFEEYRWFITSDGFLVIGGRNAKMNEEIVSKHMESRDLFFHTQTPGAPVVILKRGQDAPESSIVEAAEFAATYSSLWKEGKHVGEVYYVTPEQVKRAAKAGEYLPKGSFYITGKREYMTVELNCAIGVEVDKLRVIGGPKKAVQKWADYLVEIEVGDKEHNDISVEIAKKLVDMAGDEKHILRAIVSPDEVAKFLPPGRSRIKES
ncbi:MAG: ribosome rescue protein RqcH [Archaeoglobales archaeon]|nr:ribosome rescue protein RqcH [Archaeoglobales archaeon]